MRRRRQPICINLTLGGDMEEVQRKKTRAELARERANALDVELEQALGQDVDTTGLQELAKQRASASERALMTALAAQAAGEQFAPLQKALLSQASDLGGPLKVGSAVIQDGMVTRDPYASTERRLQAMDMRARRAASAADQAEGQEERLDAQAQARRDRTEASREASRDRASLAMTLAGMRSADKEADRARGRQLSWSAVQDFSKQAGMADAMTGLANSFKDSYSSNYGLGNVQNALGRLGLSNEDQANWWQQYAEQRNLIRNQLFGSALTAAEQRAFDEANITPNMDPKQVRLRLGQQAEAAQRAYGRLRDSAAGSGFDVSGVPGLQTSSSGLTSNGGADNSRAGSAGGVMRFDKNGRRID